MAPSSQILRIPRTDTGKDGDYILGEVTTSGSKSTSIKFVATEGEEPYVLKLRLDHVSDLRVSNSACSEDEWENIIKSLLVKNEPIEGIEAGAEVRSEHSITVTIRRRIAGINQRLGSLTLKHNANEAIELFSWCSAAALGREKFRLDLAAETAKARDLEDRVTELRNLLEELTESKKARETELLEKFCVLLNEKKLKIREQQRLLASAHIDPSRTVPYSADEEEDMIKQESQRSPTTPRTTTKRAPKASRPSKRKARDSVLEDDDSDGSGFEKMDVDQQAEVAEEAPKENEELEELAGSDRQTTDNDDDDATGSEPDEDEDEEPVPPPTTRPKPQRKIAAARKSPSPPATRSHDQDKGKGKETVAMHPKKAAAAASTSVASKGIAARGLRSADPTPAAEGSETESDDEL